MSKPKKPGTRERTARRERERAARKLVRDRERLVATEPGGSAERAIEVATPGLIDGRVRATPCHQCGGALESAEVEAVSLPVGRRRVARTRCRVCHAPRAIWFSLPVAN